MLAVAAAAAAAALVVAVLQGNFPENATKQEEVSKKFGGSIEEVWMKFKNTAEEVSRKLP